MKTVLSIILSFLLFTSCDIFSSEEPFAGGRGSIEKPYQISTAAQLQRIGEDKYLNKHFIQIKDIDASETAEFNDGKGFQPIGNEGVPFTGSYNGNGFEITTLNLNYNSKNIGLFGHLQNGLIENLKLTAPIGSDCAFETPKQQLNQDKSLAHTIPTEDIETAGWLVGFNEKGIIRNSSTFGNFTASTMYLGGLVGYNDGVIENSHYTGYVSGQNSYTGGLVGGSTGQIRNSYATGCTSAPGTAGGLVGYKLRGEISNSYTSSRVWGSRVGGLVALQEEGNIHSSYASGEIMGTGDASGGLVAINFGKIEDCYSLSKFSESNEVEQLGGIVGINKKGGIIMTSYSAGKLTSKTEFNIGAISGLNEGLIEASYYDITETGINIGTGVGNPEGATGLTTAQMTGPAAEQNMPEFDWVSIWRINVDGYPVLRWEE